MRTPATNFSWLRSDRSIWNRAGRDFLRGEDKLFTVMSVRKLTKVSNGRNEESDEYWNEGRFKKFNFDDDDEEDSIEVSNWDGTPSQPSRRAPAQSSRTSAVGTVASARAFRGKGPSTNQAVKYSRGPSLSNISVTPPDASKPASSEDSSGKMSTTALVKLEHEKKDLIRQLKQAKKELSVAPTKEETLRRFMLGDPVILEPYKCLEDKKALLDHAIKRNDGNAVLAITLFLRNTLKRELFSKELMSRPTAVDHYCTYLRRTSEIEELHEILTVLGRTEEAAMLKYRHCLRCAKSAEVRRNSLRDCVKYYFDADPRLVSETKEINDQISLLARQIVIDDNDKKTQESPKPSVFKTHPIREPTVHKSVTATLYYCSYYHWGETQGLLSSPVSLRDEFKIGEKQYAYMAVAALCRMRKWRDLEQFLTSPKTLFRGPRLHAVIGFDKVVDVLSKNMAPVDALEKYCAEIENVETRLQIASKFRLFRVVINTYVQMKDRQQLNDYLKVIPDSNLHMRQYLLNELKKPDVKWKN